MTKLSRFLPDRTDRISRETLLVIADFVGWLHQNRPDAFKAAIQACGQNEVKNALNELEDRCESWR